MNAVSLAETKCPIADRVTIEMALAQSSMAGTIANTNLPTDLTGTIQRQPVTQHIPINTSSMENGMHLTWM